MNGLRLLFDLVDMGGPVMIPIGLLSVWMWVLILVKADWVWRVKHRSLSLADARECLDTGAGTLLPPHCPRAGALSYFMTHSSRDGDGENAAADQLFFEVAVRRQVTVLYRHIATILILASAAPLLGLLGTVTGMVETFRVIGGFGMGNSQAMASGIREALITTQAGLLVAIPGLLAGQTIRKAVHNIHRELLVFHRGVDQLIEKEGQKCSG